jgi:outer membrane biosynthesis protein TonB
MPEAASAPVYPPELEKSGSSGIVFAQFVITSSGKAKMATFRILRTSGERFSQAVENWVHTVTFTPATIAGRPVDQLVQQSFSFSPPR